MLIKALVKTQRDFYQLRKEKEGKQLIAIYGALSVFSVFVALLEGIQINEAIKVLLGGTLGAWIVLTFIFGLANRMMMKHLEEKIDDLIEIACTPGSPAMPCMLLDWARKDLKATPERYEEIWDSVTDVVAMMFGEGAQLGGFATTGKGE